MLQNIRDGLSGIVSKAIVGFIVLTFVFFGIETLVQYKSESVIATVNGLDIPESTFRHAVELEKRNIIYRNQGVVPKIDEAVLASQVLDKLIDIKLLSGYAEGLSVAAQKPQIDQLITAQAEFQVNGKFDPAVFKQVIESSGFTPQRYYENLKTDFVLNQLSQAYLYSSFQSKNDWQDVAALVQQRRSFSTLDIPIERFFKDIDKDDPAIKSYYEAHSDQFKTDEAVTVEYIELTIDQAMREVEISNDEVKARYEKEVETLSARKRLHAAHILVRASSENDLNAKTKIDKINEELRSGADFSELAKKYSEDKGSAGNGGDVGSTDGSVFPPEFEHALQNLQVGEISSPIKTEAGYHLIRLLEKSDSKIPKLDELASSLHTELSRERARLILKEKVENLSTVVFESPDLGEPAVRFGLSKQVAGPFGRDHGEGIAANLKVREQAFSEAVLSSGQNSEVIELDEGHYVALRVLRHDPQRQLSLNEAAEKIRNIVSREAARTHAENVAKKSIDELRSGKPIDEVAKNAGLKFRHYSKVLRSGGQDLDPQLLQSVFRAEIPVSGSVEIGSAMLGDGDQVVFLLTEVISGTHDELTAEQQAQLVNFLAFGSGKRDFSSVQRQLKTQADIVKNNF